MGSAVASGARVFWAEPRPALCLATLVMAMRETEVTDPRLVALSFLY